MKMNNEAIAREFAEDFPGGLSLKQSKEVVAKFFDLIATNLAEGHEINIAGFGKFKVSDKPERQARNPRTGEMVTVPAKKALKFTPAKALKDSVI